MVVQVLDRSPYGLVGAGRQPALAAVLREAARDGIVLDFVNNRHYLGRRFYRDPARVPGWTFSRTGAAYDLDGTTLFQANTPRRTSAGLLVEPAATNLALQSQSFSTTPWVLTNASITQNQVAPDGTTTAWLVTSTAGGFPAGVHINFNGTAAAYTYSAFVKANNTSWVRIATNDAVTTRNTWFNLSTGTIGTTQAGQTGTITALANGWYRVTVTATMTASPSCLAFIRAVSADNTENSVLGDSVIAWGVQVELGSTPTAYIPTTTTTVTRGADIVAVNPLVMPAPYTMVVLVNDPNAALSGARLALTHSDGTFNNTVYFQQNSNQTSLLLRESNTSLGTPTVVAAYAAGRHRIAGRVQSGSHNIARDGNITTDGTGTGTLGTTMNRINIGSDWNSAGGNSYNGLIELVAMFPRGAPNAELQAITA